MTFSSSSCRCQDNVGCSIYSRALAPFVTYVVDPLHLFRVCSLNITLWVVMRRVLQDILTNLVVMHGGPDYHFLSLLQNVGAIH